MNKKTDDQKNQRIQVFARCRPLNTIERKQCSPSVVDVIPDKRIVIKDRNANREFLFDRVFPPDAKQISVYKAVVEPLIKEVLMGYNCTVFAYGQTGTGKTYTMEGERNNSKCSWEDDPGAGIIPRSLHQLFEDLNREENVEFSVRVSFLELYNEELFDLLSSTELSRLRLYEHPLKKGSVIISGLEEIIVNSKDEVYAILEKGTARRQTAATMLNATSSRSHTVFSVTVHIKENTIEGEELLKTGKLNLVDLAGSENVGRSGAVDKRAREAGNINQSLLTLGRVITALIEKQPHVPYRESKLTRLLQDSLGGHTKTSIIATISPAFCNFDETISTLDYATKAKNITINPEINQKMTKRALIKEYTEEIEKLRKDLVALRSKEGFYIDMENYMGLLNEVEEKKNVIKHLSEKIEELNKENIKNEEMLTVTKDELVETNEKLSETSKKCRETALKLSNTENALNHTQKVLTDTALERDEKQLLLNVQCKTEKKLSQQAQKLLHVADETTNDVEKLHAKIDRKHTVEKNNEERCKEFRMMYQKQFAMLDDLVSHSEKQQVANLFTTKQDMDEIFEFLQNHQMQTNNYINQFIKLIPLNLKIISGDVDTRTESETKWTYSLIEKLNINKGLLSNKQSEFLLEKFPELLCELNKKNSEMEQWILSTHKQLSEKIKREKECLEERSAKRNEIQLLMKESLDALCKNYEELFNDFKVHTSNLYSQEDQFEKDFEEKLNDLKKSVMSFDRLSEWRKKLRRNAFETESCLLTNFETNTSKLKELQQPIMDLCNYECAVGDDKTALNEMLAIMCLDQFSEKQQSLQESQQKIAIEFEKFTVENGKEEKHIFSETENALKDHLSLVSQSNETLTASISAVHLSLEDYAQSGKTSVKENVQGIQKVIEKTKDNVKQSQEMLCSFTNKLKDEILKRDIEFEKFISEDLVKDIPTGTTPQRKNYVYPRLLAATSPHERILGRYRTELAANTALAINLPLNSSFNELDEFKTSPVHSEQSVDLTDVNNVSFSSNDSADCDTDSCASSVSDAGIDSVRNKENMKNSKKKSRLPKRLPHKGFVKPAQPLTRKPLVSSNSYITEHSEI